MFWWFLIFAAVIIGIIVVALIIYHRDNRKRAQMMLMEASKKKEENPSYAIEEVINTFAEMGEPLIKDYIVSNNEANADIPSFNIKYIYLSKRGIYVIDCNNSKGRIIGTVDSDYWIKEDGFETTIKNPVIPNAKRADFISRILKRNYQVYNLTVFTAGDLTKTVTDNNVINISELQNFIQKRDTKYDDLELAEIKRTLDEYQEENSITIQEHRRNLERYPNIPE